MYDILIKGGTIVDGSGAPRYTGDLAIRDGKIARIAREITEPAAQVLSVDGLVVSPGFIDMHSHSDSSFLRDDRCQSKLYQGITTEVAGQCGSSPFPGREYASMADFVQKCQDQNRRMATNLMLLVGHGTLRNAVMGSENRKATDDDIAAMGKLLEEDMRAGAWGLSLGLGYAPGVSSDQHELNELGAVVAKYDGIVTSHMRNQGAGTPESLEEMFSIHRHSGVQIHIAHFKASGKANWGRAAEFIEIVHKAKRDGIKVSVDVYPYRASSSGITNCWPQWAIQGGREAAVQRTMNEERPALLEALGKRFRTPEDGDSLYVVTTNGTYPVADGKTIGQIARELGISMPEAVLEVTRHSRASATCISFSMCESDVLTMLSQNDFCIGTDGRGFSLNPEECEGKPHPRNYGTFPRFLRLVRENSFCSLETVVHRITGLGKQIMALPNRGLLKEGYVADITVFNPETVTDLGTFDEPIRKNVGIEHVIIGGQLALRDGEQTDVRNGQFLMKR
jgi:N-acyl-D-amino-acid deacylase